MNGIGLMGFTCVSMAILVGTLGFPTNIAISVITVFLFCFGVVCIVDDFLGEPLVTAVLKRWGAK